MDIARYAQGDIIAFAEDQYICPETRKLIVLEDWQKDYILKPLFYDLDANGNRKYNVALIGLPKKNGKSTLAGVIGTYFLYCEEPFGEIIIAANDKEQASVIIYNKIRSAVNLNPNLKSGVASFKNFIEVASTGTTCRCIAHQFESAAGLNPNLVEFDEPWGFSDRKFYDELTLVPTRKNPLNVLVSYAGYELEGLLYDLYLDGMRGDTLIEVPDKEIYIKRGFKNKRMFMIWSHENLASWVTQEYLDMQRASLPASVYARFHENRWVEQVGDLITHADIERILDRNWHYQFVPNVEKGFRYSMATDLGLSDDRTAVAMVHFDPSDNKIYLDNLRLWQGTSKERVLISDVERYMLDMMQRFRVSRVVCDPWQMEHAIQRMRGLVPVRAFNFSTDMIYLSQTLLNLIRGGGLVIYEAPELIDELLSTLVRSTPRGYKLDHPRRQKNDCVIAVGMACLEAIEGQQLRPRIYY